MTQIDEHRSQTQQKLESLDLYVQNQQGKDILDDSFNEISKMEYKIKDFRQVYDIYEDKFNANIKKVHIRQCLEEFVGICKKDAKVRYMDITL